MLSLQRQIVVDRTTAVTRRVNGRAWLSAVIALFLVAVLPACWFGAKATAAAAQVPANATNNSDEEREDHRHITVATRERAAQPVRPPQRATPRLQTALAQRSCAPWSPAHEPGIPHWLACSRLSERRLI